MQYEAHKGKIARNTNGVLSDFNLQCNDIVRLRSPKKWYIYYVMPTKWRMTWRTT